jgi:hypothetical protein
MSTADFICFKTFEEIGSPTHKEVPYAFKAYAIDKARKMGYDLVLWCDSVVYPISDLKPVFDYINKNAYMFFNNIGYSIGEYTSDKCLELLNMSSDEAFDSKMLMACCMGFNFKDTKVNKIVDSYLFHATSGAYHGDWFNNNKQVSKNNLVKGHRHDQSVISILVHQNKLNVLNGNQTFFAYKMGTLPISESVCLLSE